MNQIIGTFANTVGRWALTHSIPAQLAGLWPPEVSLQAGVFLIQMHTLGMSSSSFIIVPENVGALCKIGSEGFLLNILMSNWVGTFAILRGS